MAMIWYVKTLQLLSKYLQIVKYVLIMPIEPDIHTCFVNSLAFHMMIDIQIFEKLNI